MTIKLLWAREKGMGIIPSLLHINTIFADAIVVIYTKKISVSEALCEDIERKLVSRGLNESHIRFIDTEMGALVVAVKTIAPMMAVKCCQTACANRRISSDCIAYAIRTKEGIYRHTRNDVVNHSIEVWNLTSLDISSSNRTSAKMVLPLRCTRRRAPKEVNIKIGTRRGDVKHPFLAPIYYVPNNKI